MFVFFLFLWVVYVFALALAWFEDELRHSVISKFVFVVVGGGLMSWSITFSLIYLSPHSAFSGETARVAIDLLGCAKQKLPSISYDFAKIENCLHNVTVYSVKRGRIPYFRPIGGAARVPDAFVLRTDDRSIFVTDKYEKYSVIEQALVMIHECAHNGLGAVDYAYSWQSGFAELTFEEHLKNADSFSDLVLKYCVLSKSSAFGGLVSSPMFRGGVTVGGASVPLGHLGHLPRTFGEHW